MNDVNVSDSGAFSDYHALQVELRRRLSRGLMINGSYQYALEGSSAFLGFHYGRVMNPVANVRHAIKAQWDWSVPVGRGRRYGTDMHPIVNGFLGGWEFSGAARIQARMMNFGSVRLIGMSKEDVQRMYKFDIRNNPANNLQTPFMMPDDVILNTRRAFNTSATSATGYSDLGVPEGRYFAPANSESCITLKAGDCAPRTLLIRAPFFSRIDVGVTKRFPIAGRTNVEVRFDMLNLFDNINFNPVANPGNGSDDLPGDGRLPRSGQQFRSGRPPGADLVQTELVRRTTRGVLLWTLVWSTAALHAQVPAPEAATSARTWIGHEARIEAHLKSADVVSLEDIGTGVTKPKRAHLRPADPFGSLVWKMLPPGRPAGYWESYKSEIAAYELDKLLNMRMVPPAVERRVNGELGAAVMWVDGPRSVKQMGGKVPSGPIWGTATRKMLLFDNLIGNPDRNAGNILVGPPGELILIDHSRAFLTHRDLSNKVERVDAELWEAAMALTRDDLARVLRPWIDDSAIDAILKRRTRMATEVDKLVAKKGRAVVIVR